MSKDTKNVFGSTWFGIVIGAMFGISIGIALDNWIFGIGLGIAMFLVFNMTSKKGKEK